MANRPQKLDLLRECNDQQIPPREFMGIFCNRCRNAACVNAGWSGGRWVDRMVTQVDRLLDHPQFADPNAEKFDPLRKLDFRELSEALVLRTKADPWGGPEVHFADPSRETASNQIVEDAVKALAASRGVSPRPEPEPTPPKVEPPPESKPEPKPERRNPAYFQQKDSAPAPVEPPREPPKAIPVPLSERLVNTPFPSEGVMIGGGPPPASPSSGGADPWAAPAPSLSNKSVKVAVGAKIKMGG